MEVAPKSIQKLLKKKPYFTWWIADKKSLPLASAVFAILNYGDFDDVQFLFKKIGIETVKHIFETQLKGRNNYDKKVVNFFTQYFKKHAPRSS